MLNNFEYKNINADRPHKKPTNNNENAVIVETNPVNNIHVEAPQITNIIGQPIVQQVIDQPGMMKCRFLDSLLCYYRNVKFKPKKMKQQILCTTLISENQRFFSIQFFFLFGYFF